MTEDKNFAGNRPWSKKVDPKRAQTEASRAKRQQDIEGMFGELFGAPDAELTAQMESSILKLAAIGNNLPRWDATMPQTPAREAEEA